MRFLEERVGEERCVWGRGAGSGVWGSRVWRSGLGRSREGGAEERDGAGGRPLMSLSAPRHISSGADGNFNVARDWNASPARLPPPLPR